MKTRPSFHHDAFQGSVLNLRIPYEAESKPTILQILKRAANNSPSPKGEGRGEGKGTVILPQRHRRNQRSNPSTINFFTPHELHLLRTPYQAESKPTILRLDEERAKPFPLRIPLYLALLLLPLL